MKGKKKIVFGLLILILLIVIFALIIVLRWIAMQKINSFQDCVDAGYPVMESYPRQCRTPNGRHFTEVIPEPNNSELKESFCGRSSYGKCASNSDCLKDGCSNQICRSVNEEPIGTTCEFHECYDAEKYGMQCECLNKQCQWHKNKVCFNDCFYVELARTQQERSRGLMFRESLDTDKGMLFIFEEEGKHSFWMKNTLIPLDIIWINKDKEVVFIKKNAQPCSEKNCQTISPDKEAKYVLEINGGMADEIKLEEGNKLFFDVAF